MDASDPDIEPASCINDPITSLSVVKIRNAVITRSMLVLSVLGLHKASVFEGLPAGFIFRFWLTAIGSLFKNRLHLITDDAKYYSVFNIWGKGYHHWLTEVATKILRFEEQIRQNTLILPPDVPAFVDEFLTMFGITNVRRLTGNNFFRELHIITNPRSGHYDPELMRMLRDRICERAGAVQTRERRIYVSRRNARARKVVNEGDVIAKMESFGFECLELDDVSFESQVHTFSKCEWLVSIHGAGLTNCIFMPGGAKVGELFPRFDDEKEFNACYRRLAGALGLHHDFLWADPVGAENGFDLHNGDISVNIDRLDDYLRSNLQ